MNTKFFCSIVLIALLILANPDFTIASENVATVLSVNPSVSSHYEGKISALEVKMQVPLTSTIISNNDGRAQLMFPDTTTISIAPDTEIMLAEFIDNPNEESIILNMTSGTARFITGEVSRKKPSAMIVNTPQATLGIRGTIVTVSTTGDTTSVYLTETSGLGVTITDKNTGEERTIVKPGNMILISPRGMDERRGNLDEVRNMIASLNSIPNRTQNNQNIFIADINNTPSGGLGVNGEFDSTLIDTKPPVETGLNVNLINGHFNGSGANSTVSFDVNSTARISNATVGISYGQGLYTANNGSGNIHLNGSFNASNFTSSGLSSVNMSGQFNTMSTGTYNVNADVILPNRGTLPVSESGNFRK